MYVKRNRLRMRRDKRRGWECILCGAAKGGRKWEGGGGDTVKAREFTTRKEE